ncbi:pyridoxal phosphate-dependent aminotransferase [Candidatus Rariloculus sp.]|uniref:pyridoxal phosphate-dependent aminotransferase n=1 Tax=Candidatus Rariloculus sp. TaxID=3101265 RepID=UPI003D097198
MSIRLAHRLLRIRPSATVSITAKALKLREQGADIISLSAGEPDFDTPEHVKAAAVEAIARGETKYTAVDGSTALKEAIVEKFARDNGLDYRPEQIIVSSGAKQSCYNACQALLDAGDEAIIPAPYWVSYPDMVRLADAEPVIVPTSAEQGFLMSPAQLRAAITKRTKLLIVNSPCNPTGAVYGRDDWIAIGEVLREHPRILILADEIYEHICWHETPFCSLAAACPSIYDRTITINGVSKGYAMSGWRIGYAAGPEPIIKAMTTIQSQSTTNACSISQAAACAALRGDRGFLQEMCAEFRERHAFVIDRLNRIEGVECLPGRGAFYVFPKVQALIDAKGLNDDVALCERLLETAGVALVPGSAFGARGHLRVAYAASLETLGAALDRIEKFAAS